MYARMRDFYQRYKAFIILLCVALLALSLAVLTDGGLLSDMVQIRSEIQDITNLITTHNGRI